MLRRPPRSTLTAHSFPTRRSSDLQPPVGERLARVVELCGGLGRGQAAKQHDEFLAAVARDMAMIVRNSCQRVGDRLDHAVARLVPVKVVDLLELVDVAKGDAERFESGAR